MRSLWRAVRKVRCIQISDEFVEEMECFDDAQT